MATVNFLYGSFAFPREGTAELIISYDDITLNIIGMGINGAISNRTMHIRMTNRNLAPPANIIEMAINPIVTGRLDIPVLQRSDWNMVDEGDGTFSPESGITFYVQVVENRPRRKGAVR